MRLDYYDARAFSFVGLLLGGVGVIASLSGQDKAAVFCAVACLLFTLASMAIDKGPSSGRYA